MRLFLALAMSAPFLIGCGADSQGPNTTLTVGVEANPQIFDAASTTLRYTLQCDYFDPDTSVPALLGDIAPVGPGSVNGAQGFVWSTSVDAHPGPCAVQLVLRDSDDEVICTNIEEFVVAGDAPSDIEILMICEVH